MKKTTLMRVFPFLLLFLSIQMKAQTMTAFITANPATCNGLCDGYASVTVQGGISPYQYLWSNNLTTQTVTNLCAGTYTLLVTDVQGTTATATATITEPPPLFAAATSGPITNCACNGFLVGTASGGTAPYTYLWMPGNYTSTTVANICAPGTYTLLVTDANGCTVTTTTTITSSGSPVQVTTGTQNASCNQCNGLAASSVTGGTGPYTYLWMPGNITTATAGNLCPGVYTVTVTDANGCAGTAVATVGQNNNLAVTAGGQGTVCGQCNGIASASAAGGTAPYTFVWQPGNLNGQSQSLLCAGTYTITATDSLGCTGTYVHTVGTVNNISVISTVNPITNCACNGIIAASAFGGSPPYTYLWSPGGQTTPTIGNLCTPGIYTLTVTDTSGCTATHTVSITSIGSPVVTTATFQGTTCGLCNGVASGFATGGTGPYTYNWVPGNYTTQTVTGLCSGTYTFNATDSTGCASSYIITIPASQGISLTINTTPAASPNCNGTAAVSVTGGTGPYMYTWCNGSTTPSIGGLCAGDCPVCVTDANGCTVCDTAVIGSITGLPELSMENGVSLYPNPVTIGSANASINYVLKASLTHQAIIRVNDLTGRILFEEQARQNGAINVTGWQSGIYFVTVISTNGIATNKIMITK